MSCLRAWRRWAGACAAAASGLAAGAAAAPASAPALTLEARWVQLNVPPAAPAPASGTRSWSTRRPSDAVEAAGPVLRLLPGTWAAWSVDAEAPMAAVQVVQGGTAVRTHVLLGPPKPARQLQVLAQWQGGRAAVRLSLRWTQSVGAGGATEAVETAVVAPLDRWVTVMRESGPAPAPAASAEWRSRDALPVPHREWQVRVRALAGAAAP